MLKPGDIVDNRFEVLALIGQGGLAEVFRVRHMELGSEYALKLLTWRREKLAERMVLEGRIQAQLKHPNIVSVVDLVRHEGQVGLLMEFINGDTLEAIILAGPTPVDAALRMFSGVLAAVDAAHNAGVLHRDLKPANIMLARSGSTITPKVTDFGLAKVVLETASGMTKVGVTMGTPGYLAPEQLSDASTAGKQADVFALGIILYELLTGTRAYSIADGMVAVYATANEVPTPLHELRPDIPLGVCTVVQRAIDRDPAERLQSCAEFAALLYSDHPSLLEQFSDGQHNKQVSLTLSRPSFPTTSKNSTFNQPNTNVPDAEAPPSKRIAGLWLGIGVVGLLISLTALAAVLWVNVQQTQTAAALTQAATVPQPPPVVAGTDADTEPDADTDGIADAELPADTEAVAPQPVAAPPAGSGRPAPAPTPRLEPDTEVEPSEPDTEPVEPDTEPAPEPVVAAVAVTAPQPEPTQQPETAPQPAALLQLQGGWSGTAGRQRMTLSLDSTADGTVGGRMTLSLGPTVRTEAVNGTLAPGGALTFTAGDFRFSGRATNSRLSGSYTSGGRDRTIDWSATR